MGTVGFYPNCASPVQAVIELACRPQKIADRLKEDGPGGHFLSRGCRWVQAGGGRLRAVRRTLAVFVSFVANSKFNIIVWRGLSGCANGPSGTLKTRPRNGRFRVHRSK